MSLPNPRGIDLGTGARAYLAELRETWPRDDDLAAKHGAPTGHGFLRMWLRVRLMIHTHSGYGGSA